MDLGEEDSHTQWLPLVFPNFQFTFTPDWVMTLVVWPEGPSRLKLEIEVYSYDWSSKVDYSEMIRIQDFVIRQDMDIVKVQRAGLESGVFEGCRFNSLEESLHAFQRLYVDAMGDAAEVGPRDQ